MPTRIADKYEVISKLGQGGMGTVYKVRHTGLDTIFALKVLPDHLAENPDLVFRFQREARAMAKSGHQGIVRVIDIARDKDFWYLVMDYVDGPTLAQYLKAHGRLSAPDAVDVARQVAGALAAAHAAGVVHRDVKPSNILLEERLPLRALLTDFGIAKVDDAGEKTQTGSLLGTLKYCAPEQMGYKRGKVRVGVDARTDVFSLGLVIYEMVEGRQLRADLEPHDIIGELYTPEPAVPQFTRPVPEELEQIVARAIQRDPDDRYPTMAEMLRALDRCLGDDEEKTVIVPGESTDEELERQIRALELERQRRTVQAARARVEAARERAEAAEASALAPEAFGEAASQEEAAAAALQNSQYTRAAELLDVAARHFGAAATAAETARVRRDADRAHRAMVEARATAAGAEADTAFARATAFARDGERHRDEGSWAEAGRAFEEAATLFARAAVRTRAAAEAESAQAADEARSARVSAERAAADRLAATLFREGVAQAQEGEEARRRGDHATARARLDEAAATLRDAERRAAVRRAEEAVQVAREAMFAARDRAGHAGAADASATVHGRAAGQAAEADRLLARGSHGDAARAYDDARRLYEDAAHRALAAAKRAADEARSGMRTARARADQAGAADLATATYRSAVASADAAARAIDAEDHRAARDAFAEAAARFTEAAEAAASTRVAREAERAADAARHAALRVGAEEVVTTLYGRARSADERARALAGRGDLADATAVFADARRLYEEAGSRAQESRRQAVDAARASMAERRAAAPQDGLTVRAARAKEAAGDAAVEQHDLGAAATLYDAAARLYDEASAEELEGTRRVEAEATRIVAATELVRNADADAETTRLFSAAGEQTAVLDARALERERPGEEVARESVTIIRTPAESPPRGRAVLVAGGVAATVLAAFAVYRVTRPAATPAPASPPARVAQGPAPASGPPAPVTPPPAEPASAVPETPLRWVSVSPPEPDATIGVGQSARFSAEAVAPGQEVRYAWFLDGAEQRAGAAWEFFPGADAAGRTHDVKVVATAGREPIQRTWRVRVNPARSAPVVASADPASDLVELARGASRRFTVSATDADAPPGEQLSYAWERNGARVGAAAGGSWTLEDAADGDQVTVTVTNGAGLSAPRRSWRIVAKAEEPVKAGPPRVLGMSPPATKPVVLDEGSTAEFSVKVADADKGGYGYLWFLDGREAARTRTYTFRAPRVDAGREQHQIEAEVSDATGTKAPRVAWRVELRQAAPEIVDWQPRRSQLVVEQGQTADFAIVGTTKSANVRYHWTVDGNAQDTGSPRFELPKELVPGEHSVQVALVDDRGLRSGVQAWAVQVKRPTDVARSVSPPPGSPAPGAGDERLTESDVREWLRRYRAAWESLEVEPIRGLGIVSADQTEALRKALGAYKTLRVTIKNEDIALDGAQAKVSFDRVDTDETGKTIALPRQAFRLRKGPNGVVASGRLN